MSQSPYLPPGVSTPPPSVAPEKQLLAPARRAATLMYIVGGLLAMCGVVPLCSLAMPEQSWQEASKMYESMNIKLPRPTTRQTITGAVVILLPAVLLLGLGLAVWRGRRAPIIAAMGVVSLLLAWLALNILGALVQSASNPVLAASACMLLVPAALAGLLLFWLKRALSLSGNLDQAIALQRMQYMQHLQNQQAYGDAGHGYPTGAGPPPPPPPDTENSNGPATGR